MKVTFQRLPIIILDRKFNLVIPFKIVYNLIVVLVAIVRLESFIIVGQ